MLRIYKKFARDLFIFGCLALLARLQPPPDTLFLWENDSATESFLRVQNPAIDSFLQSSPFGFSITLYLYPKNFSSLIPNVDVTIFEMAASYSSGTSTS
jgi:hypothetical protein